MKLIPTLLIGSLLVLVPRPQQTSQVKPNVVIIYSDRVENTDGCLVLDDIDYVTPPGNPSISFIVDCSDRIFKNQFE